MIAQKLGNTVRISFINSILNKNYGIVYSKLLYILPDDNNRVLSKE